MTAGAAPEYVKITAAVYADGATAGDAAKVALVLGRRKAVLETTREAIARLEKAKEKGAAIAELKQWADTFQSDARARRLTAANVNAGASRMTVSGAVMRLEHGSIEEALGELRATERSIAGAKP